MIKISPYHSSTLKKLLNYTLSFILLVAFFPVILLVGLFIKLADHGPIIFKQERIGKNGKSFTIYKFRTMIINAEQLKNKYNYLNHADGPVFKIHNDPRLTKFGKILVKTGLDELPQLINVLKGEMSLVGPRPLPVYEANRLTASQRVRELVLPGITSSWVTSGAHNLKFSKWMKLDEEYIKKADILKDVSILLKTVELISSVGIKKTISLLYKR